AFQACAFDRSAIPPRRWRDYSHDHCVCKPSSAIADVLPHGYFCARRHAGGPMLRFIARFLGLWLLAGALVALVIDGARTIAASQMVMTPLGGLWRDTSPGSL